MGLTAVKVSTYKLSLCIKGPAVLFQAWHLAVRLMFCGSKHSETAKAIHQTTPVSWGNASSYHTPARGPVSTKISSQEVPKRAEICQYQAHMFSKKKKKTNGVGGGGVVFRKGRKRLDSRGNAPCNTTGAWKLKYSCSLAIVIICIILQNQTESDTTQISLLT